MQSSVEATEITLEQVIACPKLPTLPAIAVEVLRLTSEPDVPIKKIADVVQNDQAIGAKILKTVNSSYYGLSTPCPTIARAMSYMGLNTVKSLVLGFSLVDTFKGIDEAASEVGFDLVGHWRRAIYSASGARLLAKHSSAVDPDECFIAALLHDIGALAMFLAAGRQYTDVVNEFAPASKEAIAAERKAFGFSRLDAGLGLAKSWRLPETLQSSIEYRLKPDDAPERHRRIVRCISLGVLAAVGLSEKPQPAAIRTFKKHADEWLGIVGTDIEGLLLEMSVGASELSKFFSLTTGAQPDVKAIVAEAEDARMAHQIAVDREQSKLTEQAFTDGLTGIPNRKRFDELLTKAFDDAIACDGPVAVLFCDADKFKSVNDTHGHQAGDAVLVELGRRLTAALGDAGTVCRYGGEEMAMILPNTDSDTAAQHGESIRAACADSPFDVRNTGAKVDELPVTISVGVAARDAGSGDLVKSGSMLLRAADKAVYAAKQGGRNCVRRIKFANQAKPDTDAAPTTPPSAASVPTASTPPAPPAPAATTSAAKTPAPKPPPAPIPITDAHQPVQHAILIIEDDLLQAQLLAVPLRSALPNSTIDVAHSVPDALTATKARGYDLVLCDDMLGDMRAADFIKEYRSAEATQFVPVVVLSANETHQHAAEALASGASAYIPKSRLFDDPRARLLEIVNFWTQLAMEA